MTLTAFALIYTAGLPEQDAPLRIQQAGAPPLTGKTLDGALFQLSAWRGAPIIVNFWASWCAPCREEMPVLQALHETGFRVVGVNVGEAPAQVASFASAYNLTFPILLDPDSYWLRVFRVRALPTTFFIAPDGALREVVSGGMSAHELTARAAALGKP
ncbi:MAG: TlpA family protein disulfide reductase [Chloroflexi bacterium]|nr:TlpA family protein disulfide reductase [Chloroflexota bacterium]